MEHGSNLGPVGRVREVVGILGRLGRAMKGRVREWATDRNEEISGTLKEVREELDADIQETDKK
jgi:hypothetical protein